MWFGLWGFQGKPPLNHVDSVDKKKSGEANKNIIYIYNICIPRCDFKRVLTLPSCLWWDKSWWQRTIVWWWVRCLCSWKFLRWTRSSESVFVNNFILKVVANGDETIFKCLNLLKSQSQDPTKTKKNNFNRPDPELVPLFLRWCVTPRLLDVEWELLNQQIRKTSLRTAWCARLFSRRAFWMRPFFHPGC